ncbi:MAG: membrane dipeptidase, partial [Anaerolineae bacterium]|nr:membrane dipeptidase [Anaerolineae bacterium]
MASFAPRHPLIVDAHCDWAYNALYYGRDYHRSVHATRRLERGSETEKRNGRCAVGLPELIRGRVGLVFGTVFVEPARRRLDANVPAYRDEREAHRLGMAQLDFYHRLADEDPRVALIATKRALEAHINDWMQPGDPARHRQVGIVVLMEGAEPILEPKELERWYERGVRIVGLAWDATRYAGGTWNGGRLTKLGRALLEVMAEFNVILDVSHLSHEALFEA